MYFSGDSVDPELDHVLAARVVDRMARFVLGEDDGGDQLLSEPTLVLKSLNKIIRTAVVRQRTRRGGTRRVSDSKARVEFLAHSK